MVAGAISLAIIGGLAVLMLLPAAIPQQLRDSVAIATFDVVPPPPPPPEQVEIRPRPNRRPEGASGGKPRVRTPVRASLPPIVQQVPLDASIAFDAPPMPKVSMPSGSGGLGGTGNGTGRGNGAGSGSGSAGSGEGERTHIVPAAWLHGPPSAFETGEYYPPAARRQGISGWGVLTCYVLRNHRVHGCTIEGEIPEGSGFGRAALRASHLFRLRPPTRNGEVAEDIPAHIAVQFGKD